MSKTFQDNAALHEPIAVIGLSGRFPGGSDPRSFWQLLEDGREAITDIPANRYDVEVLYDPTPTTPGKIASRRGGFLDDIERFDADFFGISPREADMLDPQQRLMLEVAWEALEDAGQIRSKLAGSRTGVYVGMWTSDYEDRLFRSTDDIDLYMTTGSGRYSASGRLSYAFDLQGPSMTVDTACSSSLVAVHLACKSLRDGESDMALAGGVNLLLQPEITVGYSRSRILSPDGRCKFGDVTANGYVRSEGAGLIVLKRLSDALADGDPIYAVIRGSAVNNDGRGSGHLVAPSVDGQVEMLRAAYRDAGVSPGDVDYVEAHGTGTQVGDFVELSALGTVLAEGRPPDRPCRVGSVKTNIGHAEAASGIAGLVKTILALQRRTLPASLHYQEPNPRIPWDTLPVVIQQAREGWPETGREALAAVNSFGITGTNAHVVLQEAPPVDRPAAARPMAARPADRALLLPLSAASEKALKARAEQWYDWLATLDADAFADVCYSAAVRRTAFEHRLAVVAADVANAREQLRGYLDGVPLAGTSTGRERIDEAPGVAFVFPGQGGQWIGMGRRLLEQEPVFREVIEACERAFEPLMEASLLDVLQADEADERHDAIDVIQPTLFAVQIALAALWRSWGIEPDAVVGHSMGEVAAAYVAGVLSLDDAARVICLRSRLMRRTSGRGAMAVVELSMDEARAAIEGYEDRLSIAVSNGPRSTVISGAPDAVDAVLNGLEAAGVFCRRVKVDVASHSPQMDPLRPELVAGLDGLRTLDGTVAVYSTVTGEREDAALFDAGYWGRNLRSPVLFSTAVGRLLGDGFRTFIEMNPHPILVHAVQGCIREDVDEETADRCAVVGSLRRDEDERACLLASVGTLWTRGHGVAWERLMPAGACLGACFVALPAYPWQRERFWYQERSAARLRTAGAARNATGHPMLGPCTTSAAHHDAYFWTMDLNTAMHPFLADHRVRDVVLFPAASFAEMALSAAAEAFGADQIDGLAEVRLEEAMPLDDEVPRTVQLVVTATAPDAAAFEWYSRERPARGMGSNGAWTRHATGRIRLGSKREAPRNEAPSLNGTVRPGTDHQRRMAVCGLNYGPAFQAVDRFTLRDGSVEAALTLPESLRAGGDAYLLHPVLLDAGFQLLESLVPRTGSEDDPQDTYLPVEIGALTVYGRPDATDELVAAAHVVPSSDADRVIGNLQFYDAAGQCLATVERLVLQRAHRAARDAKGTLFRIRWERLSLTGSGAQGGRWLLFLDDTTGLDALPARLEARGVTCIVVRPDADESLRPTGGTLPPDDPEAYRRLFEAVDPASLDGVVFGWAPASAGEADVPALALDGAVRALYLVQALTAGDPEVAPRLWLVTRGVQGVGDPDGRLDPAQAPAASLALPARYEHPALRFSTVDLGDTGAATLQALAAELLADTDEDQVVLNAAHRWVARLEPFDPEEGDARARPKRPAGADPYTFALDQPGTFDNITFAATDRPGPGPGEVEIEVHAAALNFLDVLKALGNCPGHDPRSSVALGGECAGRVTAVGEGVTTFRPGDDVVALSPSLRNVTCLASHVRIPAALVASKPAHLSYEEAAAVPIVFLTAYYAFHRLGHLRRDERVLIHSATGGVGLAAVQLARRAGADVYATAGSEEKRTYLREAGIEHVMDSRTLAFADEILEATGGRGVDLVLNALTGEALQKSFAVLAPYGRFLEIGKRDIYGNSGLHMAPFRKNASFFAIDLDRMIEERPDDVGALLREVMDAFAHQELAPLPVETFPIQQVDEALRAMARARHIGKIAVRIAGEAPLIEDRDAPPVRADGTYLITGGFGGLGLATARRLVELGARHLMLAGRRAPGAEAAADVEALKRQGATVYPARGDAAEAADVARWLQELETAGAPPLRGVFHAAGLLDDGFMAQLDRNRFERVMRPKVAGAWNLHRATLDRTLDQFVLYSSVASVIGLPGQSNYVAANAFMDALARVRRRQGLVATSINWGPWAQVGLAASRDDRGGRLAEQGLGSLAPEDGLDLLERCLRARPEQAVAMPFDVVRWENAYPATAGRPFHRLLPRGTRGDGAPGASEAVDVPSALLAHEPGRARRVYLESYIREQVAQVLRLLPARVELDRPFKTMGFDSLMNLEVRNRLEAGLGVKLSATLLWNYPTILALAPYLAEQMGIPLDAGPAVEAPEPLDDEAPDDGSDALAALSDEEAEALLAEKLAALEKRY